MQRLIIYHGDADGRCSAAIVRKHTQPAENIFYEMQYRDTPPWTIIEGLQPGVDEVWMVDFSLPSLDMQRIIDHIGLACFFWIDHHVTAIKQAEAAAMVSDGHGKKFKPVASQAASLPGIRQFDPPMAACLLTWQFLMGDALPPLPVRYIADRDVWAFKYGSTTRAFYESYLQYDDKSPESEIWDRWLDDRRACIWDLLRGHRLYGARINGLRTFAKRYGRPGIIHGTDKTMLTINYPGSGDMGQVIRDMGYDLAHCYVDSLQNGHLVRVHSIYSDSVHCGDYAQERGGGGHPGAAGWVENL